MNELEKQFQELVFFIEENKDKKEHTQQILKNIKEEDIPKKYRRAIKFYRSLSGDSKTLIFWLAKKPNLKKQYFKSKGSKFTSIKVLKIESSLSGHFPEW